MNGPPVTLDIPTAVIAGLDPAIHRKTSASFEEDGYAGQARV